jgi:hypothetical protein
MRSVYTTMPYYSLTKVLLKSNYSVTKALLKPY